MGWGRKITIHIYVEEEPEFEHEGESLAGVAAKAAGAAAEIVGSYFEVEFAGAAVSPVEEKPQDQDAS